MNEVVGYLIELGVLLLLVGGGVLVYVPGGKKRPKVTEEERIEAARAKRQMEEMVATAGWKRLCEIAEAQAQGRSNEVLLKATDNAYAQEYMKGEVNGIRSFLKIPSVVIETSKQLIEQDEEEMGNQ